MSDKSMLLIVRDARELASLRTPRMQKEAIDEYCDWVSREVTMGNFVVDPKTGEWIHSSGQILDEHREAWLKSRPHALVPAVLEDPVDDTWTANPASLTKRGARLKQLREFCGSDAAALVLLKEEAARFGVKNPSRQKSAELLSVLTRRPRAPAILGMMHMPNATALQPRMQSATGS